MPRKKNCSRGVTISGKASLALDRSPIEVLITSTVSETPLPTMTQLLIGWPSQLFIFRDYFWRYVLLSELWTWQKRVSGLPLEFLMHQMKIDPTLIRSSELSPVLDCILCLSASWSWPFILDCLEVMLFVQINGINRSVPYWGWGRQTLHAACMHGVRGARTAAATCSNCTQRVPRIRYSSQTMRRRLLVPISAPGDARFAQPLTVMLVFRCNASF